MQIDSQFLSKPTRNAWHLFCAAKQAGLSQPISKPQLAQDSGLTPGEVRAAIAWLETQQFISKSYGYLGNKRGVSLYITFNDNAKEFFKNVK